MHKTSQPQEFQDEFTIPIILCSAVVTIGATAILTPSLPTMAISLGVAEGTIKQAVGVYLFGFACSSIFCGPLSDAYGRRSIFLSGLILFILGSIGCGFAPSIEWLSSFRFIQGIGGAAAPVLGIAMTKDRYHGPEMARLLALMTMGVAISPALAPIAGSYLTSFFGWRSTFFVIGVLGFALFVGSFFFLRETLEKEDQHTLSLLKVLQGYRKFLSSPRFVSYAFFSAAMFAGLWAFLASAPFVFIEQLEMSMIGYGYYTASLVGIYVIFGFLGRKAFSIAKLDQVLHFGILLCLIGVLTLVLSSLLLTPSLVLISIAMFFYQGGRALVMPTATSRAMEIFPTGKGMASAAIKAIEMFFSAIAIVLVSVFGKEDLVGAAWVMLLFFSTAIVFYAISLLNHKKQIHI